jgi:hypothetical protein
VHRGFLLLIIRELFKLNHPKDNEENPFERMACSGILVGYIAVSHPPDTFTIPFAFVFLRFNPETSYTPYNCIYNNVSYINNATGKGSGNIPTPGFSTPDRSLYPVASKVNVTMGMKVKRIV